MKTERGRKADEAAFNKMRAQWRERIALDRSLKSLTVRVLLIIESRYLNKTTRSAFPLISTLANDAGVSDRAVRGAISEAKEKGYLTVRRRGRELSSLYFLATPEAKSGGNEPLIEEERQEAKFLSSTAKTGSAVPINAGHDRKEGSGHEEPRPEAQFHKTGNPVPQDRKHSSHRTSGENQQKEPGGSAAKGGGPPATVPPSSTLIASQRDGETVEYARFESARPRPHAPVEKRKATYPRHWSEGLSKEEVKAECQRANEEFLRLTQDLDDPDVIRTAMDRYAEFVERKEAQGADVSCVPPPSQWFRERWFERPEAWALPLRTDQKTINAKIHGG